MDKQKGLKGNKHKELKRALEMEGIKRALKMGLGQMGT